MQILVVVANTRLRATLTRTRADVEKGSSSTAFERGLVGPKPKARAIYQYSTKMKAATLSQVDEYRAKGNSAKIPKPDEGNHVLAYEPSRCSR